MASRVSLVVKTEDAVTIGVKRGKSRFDMVGNMQGFDRPDSGQIRHMGGIRVTRLPISEFQLPAQIAKRLIRAVIRIRRRAGNGHAAGNLHVVALRVLYGVQVVAFHHPLFLDGGAAAAANDQPAVRHVRKSRRDFAFSLHAFGQGIG